MATVTRLKAEVNNNNLPILGDDGILYNYYVGRYKNKMQELGYSLTEAETSALNALVEAGITNGWIDKLVYLMPLIGVSDNPKAGIVPLVDNVADYEITKNAVDAGSFIYDGNGKIMSFGGKTVTGYSLIPIPIASTDFGVDNCFSVYFNTNLVAGDMAVGNDGNITRTASRTSANTYILLRKGGDTTSNFSRAISIDGVEILGGTGSGGAVQQGKLPYQYGFFYSVYTVNGSKYIKDYAMIKGESSPFANRMSGTQFSYDFPSDVMDYYIGASSLLRMPKVPINLLAYFKPGQLTAEDMYTFNQAVFTLTTALGK